MVKRGCLYRVGQFFSFVFSMVCFNFIFCDQKLVWYEFQRP